MLFDEEKCTIVKEGKDGTMYKHIIGKCVEGKLYCVGVPSSETAFYISYKSTSAVSKDMWHYRLGHLNKTRC